MPVQDYHSVAQKPGKTDNVTITQIVVAVQGSTRCIVTLKNLYISGSLTLSASSYNGSQDVTITCNVEGTALASTGENQKGNKFLREDGDGRVHGNY